MRVALTVIVLIGINQAPLFLGRMVDDNLQRDENIPEYWNEVAERLDLDAAELPGAVRLRLEQLAGQRLNQDGSIRVVSDVTRSQQRNLEDARARLQQLVLSATVVPKRRRPTKPSKGAVRRRLEGKSQRSEVKRGRGKVDSGDY